MAQNSPIRLFSNNVYFAYLWKVDICVLYSIANDNILDFVVCQGIKSSPFLQLAKESNI